MKWLSLLLLISFASAQTLYDAPSSVAGHPSKAGFWIAHAGLLAATVYDNEVTHEGLAHHNCVEGNPDLSYHPTRGQLYAEGIGIDAVVFGFDYLLYRKLAHGSQFVGAAIGIVKHVQGGSKWLEGCW